MMYRLMYMEVLVWMLVYMPLHETMTIQFTDSDSENDILYLYYANHEWSKHFVVTMSYQHLTRVLLEWKLIGIYRWEHNCVETLMQAWHLSFAFNSKIYLTVTDVIYLKLAYLFFSNFF